MSRAELALGCWSFGGVGGLPPDDGLSFRVLEAALRRGVRHWDTAQDYGDGRSETVLGRFLSLHPGTATVATKTAFTPSATEVRRRVDLSRQRLQVEVIDLFVVHWPQAAHDPAPMIEALETCRALGLIRQIGVSNFSVAQMRAAGRAGRIDDHQLGYSLLWRRPEDEVLPYCREQGIGVTVYSPLAQGLLSGRGLQRDRWAADDHRWRTVFYQDAAWPLVRPVVQHLQTLAGARGALLEDLALRWVLTRPGVTRVLVGARSEAQLEANADAAARAAQDPEVLVSLGQSTEDLKRSLPDVGNMFLHYP